MSSIDRDALADALLTCVWDTDLSQPQLTIHALHNFHGACGLCRGDAWAIVDAILPAVEQAIRAAEQRGRDAENRRARELLAFIADGRAEYATNAPDDMQRVLDEEERVFRIAARVLADNSFKGLLPSWRWAATEHLARGGSTDEEQTP